MPSGHDHQPLPDDSDASSTRSSIDGAVQEVNSEDDTGEGTSYDRPQNPILGRWPQILVATAVMALFAVVAWLFYLHIKPSPPLEPPGKPIPQIKVMIVGDSITQGYEGDYTWHYRIWQWFRDSPDTNIAFVGPYPGTFPPPDAPLPPSPQPTTPGLDSRTWGGYARDVNPAFLSGNGHMHFAAWGRQFAQFKHVVEDEVRAHQPDYLLVALGFNDIAWLYHPWEAIQSFKTLVANARKAKPDLRFAVANVPQRTFTPGRKGLPAATDEYNALLEVAIRELDSEESPFALARLREGYACECCFFFESVKT
jgi:lysophospholipase L1-like esterase